MRLVCLCNNWLGWQVLGWLKAAGEEIVGLVVHPSQRSRFGDEIRSVVSGSDCLIIDSDALVQSYVHEQLKHLQPDIAVSVLFGYILRPEFLRLFPKGCINLHPALLPYNRGAYPNVWSIVEGTPAGVTVHYIDEGVDTGDLVAQVEVPVEISDTGGSLYRKLEVAGLRLFTEVWPTIKNGTARRTRQGLSQGSTHRIRDVEKIDEIDLEKNYLARDLINLLRARTFPPYPGAYFRQGGRKIFLRLELSEDPDGAGEDN